MNLKPLPEEIWELILSNDTTNLAQDSVNHDWLRKMKCIRKHYPHGHFKMSIKRLFALMHSRIKEDKVLLSTALFDDNKANDSCMFSIDMNYYVTLCSVDSHENTLVYIWCDKYKKKIEFRAQVSEDYYLKMRFPFCTVSS